MNTLRNHFGGGWAFCCLISSWIVALSGSVTQQRKGEMADDGGRRCARKVFFSACSVKLVHAASGHLLALGIDHYIAVASELTPFMALSTSSSGVLCCANVTRC